LKRPACSERCQLDLPGFQNLEGLLACFPPNDCQNDGIPPIFVYNDARSKNRLQTKYGLQPVTRTSALNSQNHRASLEHRSGRFVFAQAQGFDAIVSHRGGNLLAAF